MKSFLPVFIRALCSFAIGGLLVSNPQSMTSMIVQIIGGIFIFSGLMPILNYWMPNAQGQSIRPFFPVVGIGSIMLGILLLLKPAVFVTALMYILGIFIAAAGANQLAALISARKVAPLHWWVFVWPVLLLCIGILILCHPMKSASLPFFILGIACIGYGFSDLFYALRLLYYRRQKEKEYVDFEVVEDSDTSAEGEAEVEL